MAGLACADASLALMWVLPEPLTHRANDLSLHLVTNEVSLLAPPLFRAEITSVLRERSYRGELTADDAAATLREALNWRIGIWDPGDELQLKALNLARRFGRPKAYDTQYMALAEIAGCELWTGDRRLVNSLQGALPWVGWVGDFSQGP